MTSSYDQVTFLRRADGFYNQAFRIRLRPFTFITQWQHGTGVTNKKPSKSNSEGVQLRERRFIDYCFLRRHPIKPAKPMPASASVDGSGVGSDAQMDTWLIEPT